MPRRNESCSARPFTSVYSRTCSPTSTDVVLLLQSLWGWNGSFESASSRASTHGFDGLECNVVHPCLQGIDATDVRQLLGKRRQALILEITTGGGYTPDLADGPEQHLEQLEALLSRALGMEPLDHWTDAREQDETSSNDQTDTPEAPDSEMEVEDGWDFSQQSLLEAGQKGFSYAVGATAAFTAAVVYGCAGAAEGFVHGASIPQDQQATIRSGLMAGNLAAVGALGGLGGSAVAVATGFAAVRAGIVMFTIPFVFAFYPELLLIEQAQLSQSLDGGVSAKKTYLPGYDGTIDLAGLGWLLVRLIAALYLVASALTRFDSGHLPRFEVALRMLLALLVLLKIPAIATSALAFAVALVAFHKFRHSRAGDKPDEARG